MVKTVRDASGIYRTNIIAVNTLTGEEVPVTIARCPLNQRLWNLNPLAEKLESRSECKNTLSRVVSNSKKFDEWNLKYDPNYSYSK